MSAIEPEVASPQGPWTYRPAANTRRKIIRAALLKALDEDRGDGTKAIDHFARSMVGAAIDGSVEAGRFVADRVDGKQQAAAELTGEGETGPVIDESRLMRAMVLLIEEAKQRERAITVDAQ